MFLSNVSNDTTNGVDWKTCSVCSDGRVFKGSRGLARHMAWHRGLSTSTQNLAPAQNDAVLNNNSDEQLWEKLTKLRQSLPIIKRIPRGARITVARSLAASIMEVVQTNTLVAWENLLTFSYRVLHIQQNQSHKTTSITSQIRQNTSNTFLPTLPINKTSNRNVIKKIEEKISDGDLKGASRLLFSQDSLAADNSDTLRSLQSKHPQVSFVSPPPLQPNSNQPCLEATISNIISAISSFPSGSSGGLDGITPQHIKDLTSKTTGAAGPLLISAITALANLMLSGGVNKEITSILYGANLCALSKKDGGIRPIAIGSTFRRLVSKICCKSIQPTLKELFEPVQLGFGCSGGCEAAVHSSRKFLSSPLAKVFLKIDVKNAFNSIDRVVFLNEIENYCPQIFPYLLQCYGDISNLIFKGNKISSSVGCQQGDPLGPAIFSLGIHSIITKLNSKFNVWYLDDGSLGGEVDTVFNDLETLIKEFSEIGLELNSKKCELYISEFFSDAEQNLIKDRFSTLAPGLKILNKENFHLLGVPIFDNCIPSFIDSKLQSFEEVSDRLTQINSHHALCIFRFCLFAPKFIYFLRSSPIWKFTNSINKIDLLMKFYLEKILNLDFDARAWLQATLPIKFGGLGIRKISSISLPAYLSSVHSTSDLIGKILSPSFVDVEAMYLTAAKETWTTASPTEYPADPKIQKQWDLPLIKLDQQNVMESCITPADRARFLAVSERESGLWLYALPSSKIGTVLEANTLRISISLRLGLKLCQPHRCLCGRDVDPLGHHGLSCSRSAGRLFRHSSINDLIRRTLTTISIPAMLEPCGLIRDDGKRPDGMTLVPWSVGRSLVWDVTCVDTLAASHIQGTSVRAGAAADQAQCSKRRKYENICLNHLFLAFAVETMGPWGLETKKFYKEIRAKLIDVSGDPRSGSFFAQKLSLLIQRGNAASVLGTMPLDSGLDEIFNL